MMSLLEMTPEEAVPGREESRPALWTNADAGLIAVLIGVALIVTLMSGRWGVAGAGSWLIRTMEGAERRLVDVPPGKPLEVRGKLGISVLELNAQGQIRFVFSPCPHRVCVQGGWTSPPWSVACVPNGIMVEATVDRRDADFDGRTR